jgi:hypothetical protein
MIETVALAPPPGTEAIGVFESTHHRRLEADFAARISRFLEAPAPPGLLLIRTAPAHQLPLTVT